MRANVTGGLRLGLGLRSAKRSRKPFMAWPTRAIRLRGLPVFSSLRERSVSNPESLTTKYSKYTKGKVRYIEDSDWLISIFFHFRVFRIFRGSNPASLRGDRPAERSIGCLSVIGGLNLSARPGGDEGAPERGDAGS